MTPTEANESPYQATFAEARNDPEGFWGRAAEKIDWSKRWDQVLDDSHPPFYQWFVGGQLNTCHNCVDRHIDNGRGDQAALIYDSPLAGTQKHSPLMNCAM